MSFNWRMQSLKKSLCTNFFTTWNRAHMAVWPSVQPGNAILVSLPAHSFFVPWFCLSAFQLLLIQISSSVAETESDPIAVETGIWNFRRGKKKGGGRQDGMWQLHSLFSILLGSSNLVWRRKTKWLKAFVPFPNIVLAYAETQRKAVPGRLSWCCKLGCSFTCSMCCALWVWKIIVCFCAVQITLNLEVWNVISHFYSEANKLVLWLIPLCLVTKSRNNCFCRNFTDIHWLAMFLFTAYV